MEDNLLQQISKPALIIGLIILAVILWKITIAGFNKIVTLLEGILNANNKFVLQFNDNKHDHKSFTESVIKLTTIVTDHEKRIIDIEKGR